MIGCEGPMATRAASPEIAAAIDQAIGNAETYYRAIGYGSSAPGNAEGGLSTPEDKPAGADGKPGSLPIHGVIRLTQIPDTPGQYLPELVPETLPTSGFP